MPAPLSLWNSRNSYQQYFIFPAKKAFCYGGGAGSGLREIQSRFGFAFALVDRKRPVETIIFVYDKDNELRYVDTRNQLCLVPYDMGSNYDLSFPERKSLLNGRCSIARSGDIEQISGITVSMYEA